MLGPAVMPGANPFQRRRNRRPDTPEELAADAAAQAGTVGMDPATAPPPAGTVPGNTGINPFGEPQQFPGNNYGMQDTDRAGTWYSNYILNSMQPFRALTPQATSLFSSVLGGNMPPVINQLVEQLTAPKIAENAAMMNSQVATGTRQALDTLPRAAAAEAIANLQQAPVAAGAQFRSNLLGSTLPGVFSSIYPQMLGAALGAAGPETALQSGLAAWQPLRDLGMFDLQQYGQEQAAKAAGKK